MSNYTYHGTSDLIAMPGRSVQTYPSGLVRVERSFACRRGQESSFRSQFAQGKLMPLDDGKPAIDGLYIFPDPQETARDDGFVEFRVTAYGRTNTTGSYSLRNVAGIFVAQFLFYDAYSQAESQPVSSITRTIGRTIISSAIVRRVVKLTDVNYSDFVPDGVGIRYADSGFKIEDIGVVPSENGIPEDFVTGSGSSATNPIFPTISTIVSETSSQEFGIWKEINYLVTPSFDFGTGIIFFDRSTIYFGASESDNPRRPRVSSILQRSITIEFVRPINGNLAIVQIDGRTISVPLGVASAFSEYDFVAERHRIRISGLQEDTQYPIVMTYYNDTSSVVALSTTIRTAKSPYDIAI